MAGRKNLPSVDMLFGDLEGTADELLSTSTLIEIDKISPDPDQPRKISDPPTPEQLRGLEELAASIRSEGVLQPVIVRPLGRNSYILVAGERRWRASRIAGLDSIPAIVRDFDILEARVVSLIENIQREDLNEDERADALVKLKDLQNLTWKEVGDKVGLSEPRVKALARITREPESIRMLVREGLSPAHLEVTRSVDNHEIREEILKKAVENNIPVRQTRDMAKIWSESPHLPADELLEKSTAKKVTVTRIVEKDGIKREEKKTFEVDAGSKVIPEEFLIDEETAKKIAEAHGDENLAKAMERSEEARKKIPVRKLKAALSLLDTLDLKETDGEREDLMNILDEIEKRVKKLRESIGGENSPQRH